MNAEPSRTSDKRRQLFEAAIQLFREKGFSAASADEIAARAGCSRATFFNHFGSKAAVLRFYGQELEERVSALLEARSADTSPLRELRGVLLAMATEAEAQRDALKIILIHSLEDGSYFSEPSPARAKILKQIAALIVEGQKAGEVRGDLAALPLATQLLGLYNHAVVSILFGNQLASTAIAHLWDFALGGLTGTATATEKLSVRKRRK